jgi:hypothetical protein
MQGRENYFPIKVTSHWYPCNLIALVIIVRIPIGAIASSMISPRLKTKVRNCLVVASPNSVRRGAIYATRPVVPKKIEMMLAAVGVAGPKGVVVVVAVTTVVVGSKAREAITTICRYFQNKSDDRSVYSRIIAVKKQGFALKEACGSAKNLATIRYVIANQNDGCSC